MHQPIEESAGCEHHGTAGEVHPKRREHTTHYPTLDVQPGDIVLPQIEVRFILDDATPLGHEAHAVALRPWTPHGRPLAAVEQTELNG